MNDFKTVVIGASTNPERYSHQAVLRLKEYGFPIVAIGLHEGSIGEVPILTGQPALDNVHTVSLYVRPDRQPPLYDYILSLKPRRVIFNPGTENKVLEDLVRANGIEVVEACTLVLLSIGRFAA